MDKSFIDFYFANIGEICCDEYLSGRTIFERMNKRLEEISLEELYCLNLLLEGGVRAMRGRRIYFSRITGFGGFILQRINYVFKSQTNII
jgi:hypothetical protein